MQVFEGWKGSRSKAAFLVVLFAFGLAAGCSQESAPQQAWQPPVPQVSVLQVNKTAVDVFGDYPARILGSKQVEVRARVQGILQEKRFVEGQGVKKGEILFVIDPAPYQIALRRAEAELATAKAAHDHAQREFGRISRLHSQNAISERERDLALNNLELARARLSLAETSVEDARLNLGYTSVRSPIEGITGMEDVSEGNLVSWGGLLTTITANDPVFVHFSMPQADAQKRRRALPGTAQEEMENILQARMIFHDNLQYHHAGTIDFAASTIDSKTATVAARAVFPNPEHTLLPGQFARVRVLVESLEGVFLVPENAVGQGREGARVFVVGQDDIVFSRTVALGPVVEGGQVVLSGLEDGEAVVVEGHVALRDGMKVTANSGQDSRKAQ
ncbi:MAG: efflux RND transporter periplasmic adaptor subunit [Desulfatibacillaceae bacterium]|nr:efflux RND transporter periplasmic adaptor subunit [Desulfatibacillaceae bacterium]